LYDTKNTRISLGILVELNEGLREYRDSYVLVGGWAPYFITRGHFDHCGSLDIDLVLRPEIFRKYETILGVVTAMSFLPTANPFKFKRNITAAFGIELDFLTEPEALTSFPQEFTKIQDDLTAVIIPGSSLAFQFSFEAEFSGKLLDGSELSTQMKVADIVSMVGLKGHALGRILKLEKDCYDLYAICGFTAGNPTKAADEFRLRFKPGNVNEETFIEEALRRIGDYFRSENGRGPLAVSRFYGTDEARRVDSYQRLNTFLKSVQ